MVDRFSEKQGKQGHRDRREIPRDELASHDDPNGDEQQIPEEYRARESRLGQESLLPFSLPHEVHDVDDEPDRVDDGAYSQGETEENEDPLAASLDGDDPVHGMPE